MIDSVYSQMKKSKDINGEMYDGELLQISALNTKNEMSYNAE